MTLQQLLQEGAEKLLQAGIEEAGLDAKYLLFEAFGIDEVHFLMDRNRELPPDTRREDGERTYRDLISRRARRIPLQYLCGFQEFMGLRFLVNPSVLIPRQDTETLVELVLKERPDRKLRLLDMCTGSGCIAVSLKKLGGYESVTAVDVSAEALETAGENARLNGAEIRLVESNLYEALDPERDRFDVIVSNPPYIPSRVIEKLQPEVRDCEPRLALDGKEDGLFFYRRLAGESGRYLNKGGSVYFEIGYDQAEDVRGLLADCGYEEIEVIKDGPGLDRVVRAVLSGTGGTYV